MIKVAMRLGRGAEAGGILVQVEIIASCEAGNAAQVVT